MPDTSFVLSFKSYTNVFGINLKKISLFLEKIVVRHFMQSRTRDRR